MPHLQNFSQIDKYLVQNQEHLRLNLINQNLWIFLLELKPNPSKISAIEKYPIPTTTKEIKRFLGLIGYYRRFLANFARITSPLTKCLKKGAKINLRDPDYIQAFNHCKELLTNSPILAYPDFSKQFKLTTDASNVAIGAVLSQSNKPIAFYSRTLNSAEKNYSTIEKELLAIKDSVARFRPYLYGQKFIVECDHNPLVWLAKIKEPNSRLVRWKLKLEEFNFQIVYKKGNENYVADALSRIEINANDLESNNKDDDNIDLESMRANIEEVPDITDDDIRHVVDSFIREYDPIITSDADQVNLPTNDPIDINPQEEHETIETVHSTNDDDGKCIPITERSVNVFMNRLIFKLGDFHKRRISRPFNRNTHIITIKRGHIIENLSEFITDIFSPNLTYGVYFVDDEIRKPFLDLFKEVFNSSVKVVISNTYCKDVVDPEIQ